MFLSILIVCYNCRTHNSPTINSLLEFSAIREGVLAGVNVVVWNNGPTRWPECEVQKLESYEFTIVQDISNQPLGKVYNNFINNNFSHRYMILDHDSILSCELLDTVTSDLKDIKIGLPIISSNNVNQFPVHGGRVSFGPFKNEHKVYSIGSGLLIEHTLIPIFLKRFNSLFDESYALYGVDTSFFIRIHKLKIASYLTVLPKLEHSLSRLEVESDSTKLFREKERALEMGITLRNYFSLGRLYGVARVITKSIVQRKIHILSHVLIGLYRGKHPRCK